MALSEKHRGLWRRLRLWEERRQRGSGRSRRLALEVLEIRVTPALSTWNGAMDSHWSTDGNWVSGMAPSPNDDLVFEMGASNLTNNNDLTAGTSYNSLTLQDSGYVIGGNGIDLAGTLDAMQSSGVDTLNLPIDLTSATGAVSVDQSGATLILGGAVTGSNGLTMSGNGLLDLEGAGTDYSGTTTINGGTLYADVNNPSDPPVTVNSGATLGGTGTVGSITVNGGTVSPGTTGPGLLTDTGDLNMSSSSTFSAVLDVTSPTPTPGVDYSQLAVGGQVNLGGATLNISAISVPAGNNQFVLINNMGGSAVNGTFANYPEGTEIPIDGQTYQISYAGGPNGRDVVLNSLVASTTSISAVPTSVTYGNSVSLTASVMATDSSDTTPPTGTVQFLNGSTSLGTLNLTNNGTAPSTAVLSNVVLPPGMNNMITAVYSGDSNFITSTAPDATVDVAQAGTNTTVSATPSSPVSGQSVQLTATVSAVTTGGVLPTGTVQFYNNTQSSSNLLGTGQVMSGSATITTSALTAANDAQGTIIAVYSGDSNYLTSMGNTSVTVSTASTTTALTISPNPSGLGSSVNLTAVVSVTSPGSGTPTGNVEFFTGTSTTPIGTEPLSNNTATLAYSGLPMGTTTITATYEGDSNFSTSTSPQETATVNTSSTTTVSATPTTSVFGQSVTLTATVTSAGTNTATPTGNVQFFNGATSVGTATLSNGTATINTTDLPTGMLSITAQYGGDTNYAESTSSPITVNVNMASTTTTVSVSPNPSGLNQTVTLTATVDPVSPGAGSPTGNVNFFNGSTMLGTASVSANTASLPTTALSLGANSITATYVGDTNFSTSTSPAVTANVSQASTTTLMVSPTTGVSGQSITLTATVAAATGSGTPTGTVQFFSGSTSLGTATVSSGTATLTTTSLLAGTLSLTAEYSGDSTFAGSNSSAVPITITMASTTTAVMVVPNPSASGATVTITATVTVSSPGSGTPTGTVNFLNGSTSLGTGTLLSNGQVSITSSSLSVGTNSITADYEGDTNYNASDSPVFTQTVLPATTTTVASSPSPSVVGQPVTLTAGVSSTAGVPTGTVQFFNGTTSLGTATLSGGVASLVTTALTSGFNTITATYQGSSSFSPSTSAAITATVNQASTMMTLTSSANPASLGQSVTFTAKVTPLPPSTGGPTPTGSVTFMDGTTAIGTGTLTNGVATFTTSSLTTGTHSITGVYVNDSNYTSSTSPVLSQVITTAGTTVALAVTSGSANPVSNQAITLTAVVAPVSPATTTPTGTVNFYSDGQMIGSGTLTSGSATLTFNMFALGNATLTAVYEGDTNYAAGTSSAPFPIKVGDGNQLYVNQLYIDMTGTFADPTGLANYTTLLSIGYSRKYVSHQIASLEGLLKDDKLAKAILGYKPTHLSSPQRVTALYKSILGRSPTSKELKSGVAQVSHNGGINTLIINLLSSEEYFIAAFAKGSTGALAAT